jgi:hypothetical protein
MTAVTPPWPIARSARCSVWSTASRCRSATTPGSPNTFVENLQQCGRHHPGDSKPTFRIALNARVVVRSGPLVGLEGVLVRYSNSERVKLLMTLMNHRDVEVEVKIGDIEEA